MKYAIILLGPNQETSILDVVDAAQVNAKVEYHIQREFNNQEDVDYDDLEIEYDHTSSGMLLKATITGDGLDEPEYVIVSLMPNQ